MMAWQFDKQRPVTDVPWWFFVVASLMLIVTPGQDMILVMSRSIAQGPGAGVATAAGVSLGLVGAAYLVYLGVGLLRSRHGQIAMAVAAPKALPRLFVDGALSNVVNPKIAVFYFAFLPQFVPPGASHPTLSLFVLGLVFAGLTFLVKGPVGLAAGFLSAWFRTHPAVLVWIYRSSGLVLVGLGLKLALERRA